MMAIAGVVAATAGVWFAARWLGRGKPCPTLVASLFDNPLVGRISGVETVLERAGIAVGMRVLDAGCGPGRLTVPLARRVGAQGEVVALDVQQGMLDRVRRNADRARVGNVRTVKGALERNAEILHHEREGFDRILLVTVLGEVPDPAGAMQSLHGALKRSGVLSVTETILDPDYLSQRRVMELAADAGFVLKKRFGSPIAFTLNFERLQ